jgi:serine/threonine protein phosphatase PrpC
MKYSVCHDSRIGCRSMNQDRLDWAQTPVAVLLVVADGMGGHRLGDVAAQVAVERIMQAFLQAATPRLENPQQFLAEAVTAAHRAINDYAAQRAIPLDDAPRTTCVACVIQDGQALWAHVGDSRLYHLRWGRTLTRTRDHSRVQMLIDAGQITEREALTHPQRNLVFNCLGGDTPPHIDLSRPTPLAPGDILALCSDGAWAPTGDRFSSAFALPIERAVPFLLDAAEEAAGASCDNLTLLVLRWDSADGQHEAVDDDPATQPLSTVSTIIQNFAEAAILTEADIERSVAEIRDSILSQKSNGATK